MAGFGSGRHQGAKKSRVESHLVSLKVSELQRLGALAPDASGTLSWADASQAPVAFRTTATDFSLEYQVGHGVNARPIMERVPLTRVAAGFGGTRRYFQCPRPGCRRPVMVLYLASGRFYCWRCHDLAYASQCEDAHRLILRYADKARARLGYPAWRPFELAPVVRPRGMWRSKFCYLQYSADEADEIVSAAWVMRTRALADRLDKRMSRKGRKR